MYNSILSSNFLTNSTKNPSNIEEDHFLFNSKTKIRLYFFTPSNLTDMRQVVLFENKSLITTSIFSMINAVKNSFELLRANLLDDDGSTPRSSKKSSNDDEIEIPVPNFNDPVILSSGIGKETSGDEDEDDE